MDAVLGVVRIFVGGLILMSGVMKLTVPRLREAWSGQLRLARLPLYGPTFRLVPVIEVAVGVLLVLGVWPRPAAAVVALMMIGAIYVHIVVDDPSVFPLQPNAPIVPVAVLALTVLVLVGGSGDWTGASLVVVCSRACSGSSPAVPTES